MASEQMRLLEQLNHSYNIRIKTLYHLSCTKGYSVESCRVGGGGGHLSTMLQHLRFAVKGHSRSQKHHVIKSPTIHFESLQGQI